MKQIIRFAFMFCVLVSFQLQSASACSTFVFKGPRGELLFGRNLDFPSQHGHIEVNLRGVQKRAFTMPGTPGFAWVSRYGSISLNQNGRDFPYGGMNEAGLVIEQMWLRETVYPDADGRGELMELQWIQYQLDTAATVEDVIASDAVVRISRDSFTPLHFLVADAKGSVAAIEFLDGVMVAHRGADLPHAVLTNCRYADSLRYLEAKTANATTYFNDWTRNSSGRFMTAVGAMEDFPARRNRQVPHAFEILRLVSQGSGTKWSVVYDIRQKEIHIMTLGNRTVRKLRMNEFRFDPAQTPLYQDIQASSLRRRDFKPWNAAANMALIEAASREIPFLRDLPREYLEFFGGYSSTAE